MSATLLHVRGWLMVAYLPGALKNHLLLSPSRQLFHQSLVKLTMCVQSCFYSESGLSKTPNRHPCLSLKTPFDNFHLELSSWIPPIHDFDDEKWIIFRRSQMITEVDVSKRLVRWFLSLFLTTIKSWVSTTIFPDFITDVVHYPRKITKMNIVMTYKLSGHCGPWSNI